MPDTLAVEGRAPYAPVANTHPLDRQRVRRAGRITTLLRCPPAPHASHVQLRQRRPHRVMHLVTALVFLDSLAPVHARCVQLTHINRLLEVHPVSLVQILTGLTKVLQVLTLAVATQVIFQILAMHLVKLVLQVHFKTPRVEITVFVTRDTTPVQEMLTLVHILLQKIHHARHVLPIHIHHNPQRAVHVRAVITELQRRLLQSSAFYVPPIQCRMVDMHRVCVGLATTTPTQAVLSFALHVLQILTVRKAR